MAKKLATCVCLNIIFACITNLVYRWRRSLQLARPTWKRQRREQRWQHGNDDTFNDDGNDDSVGTGTNDDSVDILSVMIEMIELMEMMTLYIVKEMLTLFKMMKMLTVVRLQVGETKILELEEELRVVANNLKSLEVFVVIFGCLRGYDDH